MSFSYFCVDSECDPSPLSIQTLSHRCALKMPRKLIKTTMTSSATWKKKLQRKNIKKKKRKKRFHTFLQFTTHFPRPVTHHDMYVKRPCWIYSIKTLIHKLCKLSSFTFEHAFVHYGLLVDSRKDCFLLFLLILLFLYCLLSFFFFPPPQFQLHSFHFSTQIFLIEKIKWLLDWLLVLFFFCCYTVCFFLLPQLFSRIVFLLSYFCTVHLVNAI